MRERRAPQRSVPPSSSQGDQKYLHGVLSVAELQSASLDLPSFFIVATRFSATDCSSTQTDWNTSDCYVCFVVS